LEVFVIVMENRSWSAIAGNSSAPYINTTLIPASSYATQYFGVRHPSEPNHLWLEGETDYVHGLSLRTVRDREARGSNGVSVPVSGPPEFVTLLLRMR
jgi:hypothetical protein